jgi:hypothetical protein
MVGRCVRQSFGQSVCRSVDQVVSWQVVGSVFSVTQSVGRSVCRSFDQVVSWQVVGSVFSVIQSVGRSVGWLVGLLSVVGWVGNYLIAWLFSCLLGWLVASRRMALKGLSHEMDLAFYDMYMVSYRPKFFRCYNGFYDAKSVFLMVDASLCWLNNVSCIL